MIGGIGRHGRTRRDSRNLAGHLLKDRGAAVEIVNSAAPDLRAVIADMEIARDGSAADAAFLHAFISPARDMSRDELRQAGELVLRHFGAEDHQAAFVYHDKPRQGGEGGSHLHLVVGRVGPDGEVLPAGFEKIRMETAMRLAEFELGETATLGRHHASGVRWLRANGRADVADWLEASHGADPDKPVSAASPSKRQALARKGVELADVADVVRSAWSASDGGRSFAAALRAEGLDVVPGEKAGVFVVRHGNVEIGALDRIVKIKRREVAARMEGFEHGRKEEDHQSDRGDEGPLRRGPQRDGSSREARAAAPAPRGSAERGAISDGTAPGRPRDHPHGAAPAAPVHEGAPREGRPTGRIAEARLTAGLAGFSISPGIAAEMDFVRIDALKHRGLSTGILSRQLALIDWGRLREIADGLLDFASDMRRKIRFGDPDPRPIVTPAARPIDPPPPVMRPVSPPKPEPDEYQGFVLRP